MAFLDMPRPRSLPGSQIRSELPKLSASLSGVPELSLHATSDLNVAEALHDVLREPTIRLLSWLALISASGAFAASKRTHELMSARVAVIVKFDMQVGEELSKAELASRRRRVQTTRSRLPHTPAEGPLRLYVHFPLEEVPLRVINVARTMAPVIPMLDWAAVNKVRFICRNDLECLDPFVRGKVGSLGEIDMMEFLEEPAVFRNLERLSLGLSALMGFSGDFCVPQLRRLKLFCRDSSFSNVEVARVSRAFPKLQRMHLAMVPSCFAPFTSSGFVAPPDFRLTVMTTAFERPLYGMDERKASVFVAAHLMTLPFGWSGALFQNVTRLQMAELSKDQAGLAMEELGKLLKLPQLRRLGTVSLQSLPLVDALREESNLEELVLVMDLEHAYRLFRQFLVVEQQKRRCSLKRLSVHLLADDGVGRPRVEVETAVVAGFYIIATTLLRPHGYLSFSHGNRQLSEMALAQLCWYRPAHFCLDWTDYGDGKRLPCCTPNERPLPYHSTEGIMRPRGTLVAGTLRRETEEELAAMRLQAEEALLSEDVDSFVSRKIPTSRRVSIMSVGSSRPASPRLRRPSLSPAADALIQRRSSLMVMSPVDEALNRRRQSVSSMSPGDVPMKRRSSMMVMSPVDEALPHRRPSMSPADTPMKRRSSMMVMSPVDEALTRRRPSLSPADASAPMQRRGSTLSAISISPPDTAAGRRRPSMSPVDIATTSLMRRTSMSAADAAFLLRRTSINPADQSMRRRMSLADLSSFRRKASLNLVDLPPVRHLFLDMSLVDAYEALLKYKQDGGS